MIDSLRLTHRYGYINAILKVKGQWKVGETRIRKRRWTEQEKEEEGDAWCNR